MSADRTPPAHDRVTVAYATLRSYPDLDLEGFAARLAVDVPTAAVLLDQLVDLSLAQRNDESGRFSVPSTPLVAIQQIIQRERAALDARRLSLNESYEMLAGFMADLPTPGRETPGTPASGTSAPGREQSERPRSAGYSTAERIEGVDAVRRRLQELADQARHEVLSFAPPARDSAAARHASQRPDREVLARGVTTRTLYLDTIVAEPQALAYAAELAAAGGQVRLAPSLPIRLIVIDREVAAVPLDPQDGTVGALIVHDAGTVSAMVALFEAYWREGRTIPCSNDAAEFSVTDTAILRLLASGAKDEAVARQLGVSVRTVRRAIANLMDRLHADSRFELAVRAANRGLLD